MYRSGLFCLLLMLSGAPVAAQHTATGPRGAAVQIEQVRPHWPGINRPYLISSESVPLAIAPMTPRAVARQRTEMFCPSRTRRTIGGAALGLVIGGMIGSGLSSTGILPALGVDDMPRELVYVPLFAVVGGIGGGIIGAGTARCT
jgi:hypothetical protein